jgi:hypothetical protein
MCCPYKRVCISMCEQYLLGCIYLYGLGCFTKPFLAKYYSVVSDPSKTIKVQCHASSPPHALTRNNDCEKIAEGKQTNKKIHRVADSVRLST